MRYQSLGGEMANTLGREPSAEQACGFESRPEDQCFCNSVVECGLETPVGTGSSPVGSTNAFIV